MIRAVAGLLAADLLLCPLGAGALLATGGFRRLTPLSRLPVSLLCGLAGFCVLVPPLLYAGLSPTPLVVVPLSLAVLGLGLWLDRRRPREQAQAPARADAGGLLSAALLAPVLAPLAADAVVRPMSAFDAFADWTLKAKMLYGHGGVLAGALDHRVFTGHAYRYVHREYPLGQPSLEAFQFHLMGSADTRVIHLHFVLLLAASLSCLWTLLRPCVPAPLLCAGLLSIALMPDLQTQLLSGYADAPLACLLAPAVVAAVRFLDGEGADRLALATLLAAAALATKQEGIPFTAALFGVCAVVIALRRHRQALRRVALAVAAVGASALPWQIFVRVHGIQDRDIAPSLGRMAGQLGNVSEASSRLGSELWQRHFLWAAPIAACIALACLLRPGARALGATALGLLAGLVGGLVVVYWNSRTPVRTLLSTSAHRVVVTPVLVSASLLPLLLTRALALSPIPAPRGARLGSNGALRPALAARRPHLRRLGRGRPRARGPR